MDNDNTRFESPAGFYTGFCPKCGTGPLRLRTCGSCAAVVLVCDECDVAWRDARVSSPPATTGSTTLPCPHCKADLYAKPGHWSTSNEVDASKWVTEAVANDGLTIRIVKSPATHFHEPDIDDPV